MDYVEIIYGEELYPKALTYLSDAPKKLYAIGDVSLLNSKSFAIVGTRRSSPYGRWAAYNIAGQIADSGLTVISGLAEGIDTQAHLGCLYKNGKTIAVLGTSIDVCYPKSNEKLYNSIAENGLIISEYGPKDKTGPWCFPQRNRIISGLSTGVIVAEGAMKSGSMITANFAVAQSKDLYAVPGNINQPNAYGANRLIYDGAIPITSVEDVKHILGIEEDYFKFIIDKVSKDEALVLEYIKNFPGTEIYLLSSKLDRVVKNSIGVINSLKFQGFIKEEEAKIYLK